MGDKERPEIVIYHKDTPTRAVLSGNINKLKGEKLTWSVRLEISVGILSWLVSRKEMVSFLSILHKNAPPPST